MHRQDLTHALEAFMGAQALADWKEGGPVKATANRAAARAEEDFFRLLLREREHNINQAKAA